MKKKAETPAQEAMRHARKLARIKSRTAMFPVVRLWAAAMKRSIVESYYGR